MVEAKHSDQTGVAVAKSDLVEQELLHSYSIRPKISQKFRPADVKELLHTILLANLADKEYNTETFTELARHICAEIKEKLKTLNYDRYKFVVNCVIGEQKGAGINMSGRCMWVKIMFFLNFEDLIFRKIFLQLLLIQPQHILDKQQDSDTDNFAESIYMNESLFCVAAAYGVYYY